jgi:hypothetical protein
MSKELKGGNEMTDKQTTAERFSSTLRILCGVLRLQWLGPPTEAVGRSMPHRISLN